MLKGHHMLIADGNYMSSKMAYNIAPSKFLKKDYLSKLKESEYVKHRRQFTFLFQQLDKKRAKLVFIMTNKRVAL